MHARKCVIAGALIGVMTLLGSSPTHADDKITPSSVGLFDYAQMQPTVTSGKATIPAANVTNVLGGESACVVDFYGYIGHAICDTDTVRYSWYSNEERMFIIGLDHAVWNIYMDWNLQISGWRSLGGWLDGGVYGEFWPESAYYLKIWSIGGDGRWWCRRLDHIWLDWTVCS